MSKKVAPKKKSMRAIAEGLLRQELERMEQQNAKLAENERRFILDCFKEFVHVEEIDDADHLAEQTDEELLALLEAAKKPQ
jgi:hypothetical protein